MIPKSIDYAEYDYRAPVTSTSNDDVGSGKS